jgi:predicted Holliday junction resolvase-like endonuclease
MSEEAKYILIGASILVLIPVLVLMLRQGMDKRQAELRRQWRKDGQDIERECYGRTTEDWLFAEQIEQGEKLQRAGVLMHYGDFASNHVDHVEFSQN